jgi:uncharacterized membrane protein YhaH (DUF805 family)
VTDPVRLRTTRLRDRPLIYVLCVIVGIAVVSTAILIASVQHEAKARARGESAESKARVQQLQDVICGVYTPIANLISPPPNISVVGRTIIAATRHGALVLHCPGIR